jgi:hypothetical protein
MTSLEFIAYLLCARQARILIKACPDRADHYKNCCRYWLTMARKAQAPPLP